MTYTPIAPSKKAAFGLKSLTVKGIFIAGMLFAASPALALLPDFDPDNPNEPGPLPGCAPSDVNVPQKCPGVPAPLAAAGIPALMALGGGFIAIRKRRRDSGIKK